jgi:uncharacterized membrane protein YccC
MSAGAGNARPESGGLCSTGANVIAALRIDLTEVEFSGPRARQAALAALVVAVSVGVASAMSLPDVWWAAISGFISTQATRPASIKKGVLRIAGTVAGAVLALVLVDWLAYDIAACCVALFLVALTGIVGLNVSPHGYAWLFFSITFSLVLLMSLVDPLDAFGFAAYRTLEVVIGTTAAIVAAVALAPEGSGKKQASPSRWGDLFNVRWPVVLHAVRGGIAVAAIPLLWSYFYLPGISGTATTMASVLAVPVLADRPLHDRMMIERALHRLLGCLVGGGVGLVLIAVPLTDFVPWLCALAAGTWLFAYIQGSARGIGYFGTQAAVVFMMTLVQGEGPPDSILPGLNRLAGIIIGVATLFFVTMLLQSAGDADGDARVTEAVPSRS